MMLGNIGIKLWNDNEQIHLTTVYWDFLLNFVQPNSNLQKFVETLGIIIQINADN